MSLDANDTAGLLSVEYLSVDFVCNPSVEQCRHGVDLLLSSILVELAVTVGIFQGDAISHGELHNRLIEEEQTVERHVLDLSERYGFGFGALDDFLDSVFAVLSSPALHERSSVVRVEPYRSNIVILVENIAVEILVKMCIRDRYCVLT